MVAVMETESNHKVWTSQHIALNDQRNRPRELPHTNEPRRRQVIAVTRHQGGHVIQTETALEHACQRWPWAADRLRRAWAAQAQTEAA